MGRMRKILIGEKPQYKKTGKQRGAVDAFKGMRDQAKAERKETVDKIKHPVKTGKAAAKNKSKEKASSLASWVSETAKKATIYRLYGTCSKCGEPNKPRHRCRIGGGWSQMDPDARRAELARLRALYGNGTEGK